MAPSQETSDPGVSGSTQLPSHQAEKFTAHPRHSVKRHRLHSNCKCSFARGEKPGLWGQIVSVQITLNQLPNALKPPDFSLIKWGWS